MDLRHLRYFVAVAETLNFARAAERIGMEQSPLSRAIRELEADLGCELFVRCPQRTRMSVLGERFLIDARSILQQVKEARSRLRAVMAGRTESLRIGVSPAVADSTLAQTLAQLRTEHSSCEVVLRELAGEVQLAELQAGEIDLGLAPAKGLPPAVSSQALWQVPLALMLPAGHPWERGSSVSVQDLARERALAAHLDTVAACHALEGSLQLMESVHLSLLIEQVAAGLAVGIVSASQLSSLQRADVVVLPTERCPLVLTAYAYWRGGHFSSAAQRFLQYARSARPDLPK